MLFEQRVDGRVEVLHLGRLVGNVQMVNECRAKLVGLGMRETSGVSMNTPVRAERRRVVAFRVSRTRFIASPSGSPCLMKVKGRQRSAMFRRPGSPTRLSKHASIRSIRSGVIVAFSGFFLYLMLKGTADLFCVRTIHARIWLAGVGNVSSYGPTMTPTQGSKPGLCSLPTCAWWLR